MGRAHRFEDLKVWQAVRELVQSVYELTGQQKSNNEATLRDQL